MQFKVVGGIHSSTEFNQIESYEEYGPYDSYQEAYDEWKAQAWTKVDNSLHRLWIERIETK